MTGVLEQTAPTETAEHSDPSRPRLLMLTHRLPYPPDRGDRIRSYHMLKELAKHFEVGIACTSDEPVWLQHHQLLSTIAKRVAIQPISLKASKVKALAAVATGNAVTIKYYYRQGLADTIMQWQEEVPFDVILTFCTGMLQYARLLRPANRKKNQRASVTASGQPIRHVIDLVDVDSLKWQNYADHSWPPMRWLYHTEAQRLKRIEAGKYDHFDAVTVVSPAEAEAYRQSVGDHPGLTAINNGVDLDYFAPLPDSDSKSVVFVGVLNYKPNADGVVWFTHQVLPRLRAIVPDAKFLIVGRHPTQRVEELGQQPGVEVVGSVPDVRIYLSEASTVVVPLQIARGVQNKVLEAMACGKTVVCSRQAAEGIQAKDGDHMLVANDPDQWALHLSKAMNDSVLRQRIGHAARLNVEQHYSWSQCLKPLVQLLKGQPASTAS